MFISTLGHGWYEGFSRNAEDLYPGRYTPEMCRELAACAYEILEKAEEKHSFIVAHNYLYPEFYHTAHLMADSLGLARAARERGAPRVDFQSVYFMAETAKILCGDRTRVFVSDAPYALGCSLVFGTDMAWVRRWKERHPDGALVTYINSSAYLKSISDYISTSRNTDAMIMRAAREHPGSRILVLPDKFLGYLMRAKAIAKGVREDLIDVYHKKFASQNACCYVHEVIGTEAIEEALDRYPDAELMIHPECGCASSCLLKLNSGIIPRERAYFFSTEQMADHVRRSPTKRFVVATEKGMIYRLRVENPDKRFYPVSFAAECGYMKENTLQKLLASLTDDRREIVFCNDCCDPASPLCDDAVVHIPRSVADGARRALEKMLT